MWRACFQRGPRWWLSLLVLERWLRTPRKSSYFSVFPFGPSLCFSFLPVALKHNSLTDRLSRKTRQWAVEWVGLRSHQGIDGHLKGKGQAFTGYPQLALVKTFFFCQQNRSGCKMGSLWLGQQTSPWSCGPWAVHILRAWNCWGFLRALHCL